MKRWKIVMLAICWVLGSGCMQADRAPLDEGFGIIEGTIKTMEGAPAAGSGAFIQDNLSLFAKADQDGRFRIADVPAGTWIVLVFSNDGMAAARQVSVFGNKTTHVNLVLASAGVIRGVVALEGEEIYQDTLVYLPGTLSNSLTDRSGAFELIGVQPGCHTIRAEHAGFTSKGLEQVCVEAGEYREVGEFTLTRSDPGCLQDGDCETHQVCLDNRCVFESGYEDEVCDGQDNDGDGLTDEGIVESCGTDVGACRQGIILCLGGVMTDCLLSVDPEDEICDDGIDNDCDGRTDDCSDLVCAFDGEFASQFDKRCDIHGAPDGTDCVLSTIAADCCGNGYAVGIPEFLQEGFELAWDACLEELSWCGCPMSETRLEDGTAVGLGEEDQIQVRCKQGTCQSYLCTFGGDFADKFEKSCSDSSECALTFIENDCCGNPYAVGIPATGQDDLEEEWSHCRPNLPRCGCPTSHTYLEDGSRVGLMEHDKIMLSCRETRCQTSLCTFGQDFADKFDRTCSVAADCDIAYIDYNCCGTLLAVGIPLPLMESFDAEWVECRAGLPECACASGPTQVEDGTTVPLDQHDLIAVSCDQGVCKTYQRQ